MTPKQEGSSTRGTLETHAGDPRLADLGNAISDAVHKALSEGLEADFACSVIVGVAADYWMQAYDAPPTDLANILAAKAAPPDEVGPHGGALLRDTSNSPPSLGGDVERIADAMYKAAGGNSPPYSIVVQMAKAALLSQPADGGRPLSPPSGGVREDKAGSAGFVAGAKSAAAAAAARHDNDLIEEDDRLVRYGDSEAQKIRAAVPPMWWCVACAVDVYGTTCRHCGSRQRKEKE